MTLRGRCCAVGGECIAQPAGVRLGCGDVAGGQGTGASLCGGGSRSSTGMCCEVGEECIAQSAGVRRGCVGERKCAGAGAGLRWGMGGEVGGRASALRGGAKVLGKGVSQCGGGSRLSAENGL